MLLSDGSCPRCDPPTLRSTAEKLRLAQEYKDPRLQRRAEAEIDAGIATGLGPNDELAVRRHPDAPTVRDVEEIHRRIDAIENSVSASEQRITDGIASLLNEVRAQRAADVAASARSLPPTG